MADKNEKKIEELLQQGKSKKEIWKQLRNEKNSRTLLFSLNNYSLPQDRKTYLVFNLILAMLLSFVTAKKLLTALSFSSPDIFLLLGLVVPITTFMSCGKFYAFSGWATNFSSFSPVYPSSNPKIITPKNFVSLAR